MFCAPTADGREVCVSPLSIDAYEENHAYTLGDDTGYFIYEVDAKRPSSGIEILGKAVSYEAALRLVDIYVMAIKSAGVMGRESERPLAEGPLLS